MSYVAPARSSSNWNALLARAAPRENTSEGGTPESVVYPVYAVYEVLDVCPRGPASAVIGRSAPLLGGVLAAAAAEAAFCIGDEEDAGVRFLESLPGVPSLIDGRTLARYAWALVGGLAERCRRVDEGVAMERAPSAVVGGPKANTSSSSSS